MNFFADIFVVAVIVGLLTRGFTWLYKKYLPYKRALLLSYATVFLVMGPFVVRILGFDVAVAVFGISLIFWFILDQALYKKKEK